MLLDEAGKVGVEILLPVEIESIAKVQPGFEVKTSRGLWKAQSLVVATGGLSIPPAGASPLGYRIAEQFGLSVVPPVAGLAALTAWGREVAQTARTVEHPFNAGLMLESLAAQAHRAIRLP